MLLRSLTLTPISSKMLSIDASLILVMCMNSGFKSGTLQWVWPDLKMQWARGEEGSILSPVQRERGRKGGRKSPTVFRRQKSPDRRLQRRHGPTMSRLCPYLVQVGEITSLRLLNMHVHAADDVACYDLWMTPFYSCSWGPGDSC